MKITLFEENLRAAVEYLYDTRNTERYYDFKSKLEIDSFIRERILETIEDGSLYSSTAGLLVLCSYGEEDEDTVFVNIYVDPCREYRANKKSKAIDTTNIEFKFIRRDDND